MVMSDASARSDVELAAAARTDPEAFGEVYRRNEQAVLAYFLHWSRVPEVAADLTAEIFAAALGSIASYEPHLGDLRAWLFGIAHHVLARSLRRGRVEDDARRRLGIAPVVIDDGTFERIEAIASLNGTALKLLDELPEATRTAIFARVVEERE
jgi:DNA-directed RNA polymerase specialized sigma24 family protein